MHLGYTVLPISGSLFESRLEAKRSGNESMAFENPYE